MARGKTEVLFSGKGMTNALQYTAKVDMLGYAKATVMIHAAHIGSGITYNIRGYVNAAVNVPYSIHSGTITTSGSVTIISSGLDVTYEALEVGAENTQDNRSGAATIIVARKRQ